MVHRSAWQRLEACHIRFSPSLGLSDRCGQSEQRQSLDHYRGRSQRHDLPFAERVLTAHIEGRFCPPLFFQSPCHSPRARSDHPFRAAFCSNIFCGLQRFIICLLQKGRSTSLSLFSSGFLLYRWPDCLPNDRCERHPPRSRVRSRGVATAPSYDFGSGRGPSESASARGGNEGDHCTHASQPRPITDRNPHAGISRAPERRRQSTATTCARHQTEPDLPGRIGGTFEKCHLETFQSPHA
jgi:hypothetical protein